MFKIDATYLLRYRDTEVCNKYNLHSNHSRLMLFLRCVLR